MREGDKTHSGVGSLTMDVNGARRGKLVISGVHVATTVVEFSTDGFTTTEVLPLVNAAGASAASSVSTEGTFRFNIPDERGKGEVRSRISAYTSGSPRHVMSLL